MCSYSFQVPLSAVIFHQFHIFLPKQQHKFKSFLTMWPQEKNPRELFYLLYYKHPGSQKQIIFSSITLKLFFKLWKKTSYFWSMNITQLLVSSSDFSASKQKIIVLSYFIEKSKFKRGRFCYFNFSFLKTFCYFFAICLILPDVTKIGRLIWLKSLFLQLLLLLVIPEVLLKKTWLAFCLQLF